eukprot:2241186-Amphidinium_carterae.1
MEKFDKLGLLGSGGQQKKRFLRGKGVCDVCVCDWMVCVLERACEDCEHARSSLAQRGRTESTEGDGKCWFVFPQFDPHELESGPQPKLRTWKP